MDRVRPRRQTLGDGASGWYRCSGCRVSDGGADSSVEKRISLVDARTRPGLLPGG